MFNEKFIYLCICEATLTWFALCSCLLDVQCVDFNVFVTYNKQKSLFVSKMFDKFTKCFRLLQKLLNQIKNIPSV